MFNPFRYIAGGYSLIIGILILLLSSLISFYSNTHFPDLISVKIAGGFPLLYLIIQSFLNWIVVSIIFYLMAIIASKSKVRIVDVFGTQALARFPYLIVSLIGFSSTIDLFGKYILWNLMKIGEPIDLSISVIVIAILLMIFTLFLTVWMIILMFNAFKVSANLKGAKLILLFISGIILSTFLTGIASHQLIQLF